MEEKDEDIAKYLLRHPVGRNHHTHARYALSQFDQYNRLDPYLHSILLY